MRWAVLLLFAALPLQWIVVPIGATGGQRLHILVLVLFAGLTYVRVRSSGFRPVLSIARPFIIGMGTLALVWAVTSVYHGFSPRDAVESVIQLFVFVALGTVLYRAARDSGGRSPGDLGVIRWCGLAANVSLLVAMSVSLSVNAVNPVEVFSQTIATGDPNVLQRELFRSAFVGFGIDSEDARSQLRHEIFGSLLAALWVSVAAERLRPFRSRAATTLFRFSIVLSVVLVLISLGRSVILAMLAWPLLSLWRSVRAHDVSPRQLATWLAAALCLAALGATGFLSVLWVRFTQDTSSYESRGGLLEQAFRNIVAHPVVGGTNTVGESSHNFILDSWLRTGIVGGVAAAFVMLLLLGLLITLVMRLHKEPLWMVPVVAALTLVCIRTFTAGGGAIPPVEWVALAFVAGFMAHRRQVTADDVPPDGPVTHPSHRTTHASLVR